MEIEYTTPSGNTVMIPVPEGVDPNEYVAEQVQQIDRAERVQAGADQRLDAELNEGVSGAINQGEARWPLALLSEFGRNFAWGAPENLEGAGLSGSGFEGGPVEPRDFYERRDAARLAQDQYTEESGLWGWADDAASLTGVVTAPGPKGLGASRFGRAAQRGVTEGAASGALEGEAQNVNEMLEEAFLSSIVGGGGSVGLETVTGGITGGLQRLLGDEDSGARYDAQKELGMDPTAGSVGNEAAAGIENNRANSQMSGPRLLSNAIPDAKNKQAAQWETLTQNYNMAMKMIDPDFVPISPDEFASRTGGSIERAQEAIQGDRQSIGDTMAEAIPGDTQVNTRLIQETPDVFREQGRHGLAGETEEYINQQLLTRPETIIDNPLQSSLTNSYQEAMGQLQTMRTSLSDMKAKQAELRNNPGNYRQAARRASLMDDNIADMEKQIALMETNIGDIRGRMRNNTTMNFGDVKDFRTGVGQKADSGGPNELAADTLNEAATISMADAAGPQFRELNEKFRQTYADDEVIGKYFKGKNSSILGTLKTAVKGGNTEILDTLEKRMSPEDWTQVRSGLVDQMSRGPGGEPSMTKFSKEYGSLGDDMRRRLAGSDEAKALLDAVSSVVGGMQNQVKEKNFSQTARNVETSGVLAMAFNNPMGALSALTVGGIADTAIASKALAAAVAGRPNALNSLVKQALERQYTREDAEAPTAAPGREKLNEGAEALVEEVTE